RHRHGRRLMSSASIEHRRNVRIRNKLGMHARPAAEFVKCAKSFNSKIRVRKADMEVDGKSIMGLMMLAAERGAELEISAAGADAVEAVDELARLIESGFGEK